MDKQLLKNLIAGKCNRTTERDFDDGEGGKVKVYTVEGNKFLLKFWNSSNNNYFDTRYACEKIGERYIEDEEDAGGTVSINFNDIMFEIEEK